MFVRSIASLARFAPGKMGKTTVAEGEFLFAGLNDLVVLVSAVLVSVARWV